MTSPQKNTTRLPLAAAMFLLFAASGCSQEAPSTQTTHGNETPPTTESPPTSNRADQPTEIDISMAIADTLRAEGCLTSYGMHVDGITPSTAPRESEFDVEMGLFIALNSNCDWEDMRKFSSVNIAPPHMIGKTYIAEKYIAKVDFTLSRENGKYATKDYRIASVETEKDFWARTAYEVKKREFIELIRGIETISTDLSNRIATISTKSDFPAARPSLIRDIQKFSEASSEFQRILPETSAAMLKLNAEQYKIQSKELGDATEASTNSINTAVASLQKLSERIGKDEFSALMESVRTNQAK